MSQRKLAILIVCIGMIAGFSWLAALLQPTTDEERWSRELSQVNVDGLIKTPPVAESIAFFQNRLKANPKDGVSFTILGDLFMQQARDSGDASGYLRAEEAYLRTLDLIPDYVPAQASLATAYHAQHRFNDALVSATQAYETDPRSLQALAAIGDAYLELGRYEDAEDAYLELHVKNPTAAVFARLSRLAYLKGDRNEAVRLMRNGAQEELRTGQAKESLSWYLVRSGDLLFDVGRLDEADEHIEAALRLWDGYYLALASMGKIRAAQGNYNEAVDYYERSIDIVPLPANLAALGDLYSLIGEEAKAKSQYGTIEVIAALETLNQVIYNRELAIFYADHDIRTGEAVELAKTELEIRKDVFGYDALAWSLHKNGDSEQAVEPMQKALEFGTQDARIYYHAGMIFARLGHNDLALDYLERSLELNPYFSLLQTEVARDTIDRLESKSTFSSDG